MNRIPPGSGVARGLLLLLLLVCATHAIASDLTDHSERVVTQFEAWLTIPRADRPALVQQPFASAALTREEAARALEALHRDSAEFIRETRCAEMRDQVVELDGRKMKFKTMSFSNGTVPPGGRSLFLSMHGGGGAPHRVNESQWENQVRLGAGYKPAEGIYLAPRAPTDDWDLWHKAHIDLFFDRLIENLVVLSNVNPNRVYLMGYSAGGDGAYQLAPRMADRWAAASMMAGHPNDASPLGLRNVPFSIQVGELDGAYQRNRVAEEWGRKLDELQKADPGGYMHFCELHAGKPHWMDLQDRKAVPWMENFTRTPLPRKLAWHQDDVTHERFYWLAIPEQAVRPSQRIFAELDGQTVTLNSTNVPAVTVMLNDAMLDLDRAVVIRAGGQVLFSNVVSRSIANLQQTYVRGDTNLAFSAATTVNLP